MTIQSYTRNEIAKRSRMRQQIRKEEAEKLNIAQKKVWVNNEQVSCLQLHGIELDDGINEALSLYLLDRFGVKTGKLPKDKLEENAFIRQQKEGL